MAYTRVNWEDLPSTDTPINATNLNKMDEGIKTNDDKLLGNTSMGSIKTTGISINNKTLDYDYGTFTPTIQGETTAGTATYTTRYGKYVRVGKLVHIEVKLACTLTGSAGLLNLSGLPFSVAWNEPGIVNVVTTLADSSSPWCARTYGTKLVFNTYGLGNQTNKNWSSTNYIYISGTLVIA